MEEEPPQKIQRGKSPQLRLSQAAPVQIKASPVQARQAAARQSFSSNPQQSWGSAGVVTKTAVSKMESDEDEDEDDWSEVSELQEIDPRQLQGYKDQNGNVDKKNFGKGKNCLLTQPLSVLFLPSSVNAVNIFCELQRTKSMSWPGK